jgi:hypothetical protein
MGAGFSVEVILDPYYYGLQFEQVQYIEFFCSFCLVYYAL